MKSKRQLQIIAWRYFGGFTWADVSDMTVDEIKAVIPDINRYEAGELHEIAIEKLRELL